MAPRWIGTRCRPIDISDAVGYLIGCENPRTAGGEFDIQAEPEGTARRGGGEPFPGPTASRVFRGTHVFSAAPTRETGVEEQPAEGWRNCSPGRLLRAFRGCRHFHGGTGSRNGAEE